MGTKQPVKKKDVNKISTPESKLASLEKFKTARKLENVKDKDLEWIPLQEGFYDAVKIPGIPKGFFSMARGKPNTGKSTIKLSLIAQCQRMGILPVIFETEGNFPWEHAKMCGVEFDDVYEEFTDEETGEVTKKVVDHTGFFLYYDHDILYRQYGKMDYAQSKELSKPVRKIAVVEDIAYCINELLDKQGDGEDELDYEMCFIWDSVGSIPSFASVMSKSGNNMFDAGAIKRSFNSIVTNRIPTSRKENSKYTNTFFVVNKVWTNNMGMGQPTMMNSGGEGLEYAVRLMITMGGIQSAGVSKLKATSNGKDYYFGIQTKIRIDKNHVNDITYEGKICSLPHGLWNPDKIDAYKKQHSKYLLEKLASMFKGEVSESDSFEIVKVGKGDEEVEDGDF